MSNWPDIKINELCLRVVSGGTPLKSVSEYYEHGTIPWLKTGEIKKSLIRETEEYISERGLENSSAKLIPKNSVIVAMYGDGDTAGNVAINKIELTTNQACCNLILNAEKAYYQFIYYYLKGSYNNLVNLKLGGSQQNLNAQSIKNFPIKTPPLHVQKKIAAILSAYDDLIENNKRRINLLEKMAEQIYREWFVRMRFPGHEKAKFEKGIPEDWRIVELNEIAKINSSNIKRGNEPETLQYVDISSVTTNRINDIAEFKYADAPGRARRIVRHGDIIWSAVRPANRAFCLIYDPAENLIVSTGFAVITPRPNTPHTFLYFATTSNGFVEQMAMVAKGAAYPATSFDDFKRAKILLPNSESLEAFDKACAPLFRKKHMLSKSNFVLSKVRELLLPRLISGKLPVEKLDIEFPPGMLEEDGEGKPLEEAAYQ